MMSSEISIDEAGALPSTSLGTGPSTSLGTVKAPSPSAGDASKADDGFRPWHFFILTSILLATVAVILARQSQPEHLIFISFTIAAAGMAAGAFYRMLAPLTAPVVLRVGEPVSERTRSALEREKALILRSIKELEFDRGMGKLSQKDFDDMAGRLRARAISLMRQLDVGSSVYTAEIEMELAERVQRSKSPGGQGSRVPGFQGSKVQGVCACGTGNDSDAVFCKKCGTRLQT